MIVDDSKMIVQDSWWLNGSARSTIYHEPFDQGFKLSMTLRQTAKLKLLPSVFGRLYSRVKIFVFAVNSRRHFSIFVWFILGLQE